MKILLFAATKKGIYILESMLNAHKEELAGIFTFAEKNVSEDYSDKIQKLCENNNIPLFHWKNHSNAIKRIIKKLEVTHIFLVGWPFLLPESLNEELENKMIVFHDSLLPRFRGFAPLPTALICGEREVGFSVLFAEKEMDAGDIILQRRYDVEEGMSVADVIELVAQGYAECSGELIHMLKTGQYNAQPQDQSKATYSVWRDLNDMQIDWNKSAREIHNFIRALGSPYLGAYTFLDNEKVYIYKSRVVPDITFELRQPGKLWKINGETATVICGSGMLEITDCIKSTGEIMIFKNLRRKLGS